MSDTPAPFQFVEPDAAEVIPFTTAKEQILITTTREYPKYCSARCKPLVIDLHRRVFYCRTCGKVHDPFDWLFAHARANDITLDRLKNLNAEIAQKREELEDLQRQIRNAKATIRRAGGGK